MALSDLHILLFGNNSEKQLLRQKRRDLQRKALIELQQKINGTKAADSVSSCPTVLASTQGSESSEVYTLSARIQNTLKLIGKEEEGDEVKVPLKEPISPELAKAIERQKRYTPGETDPRLEGLSIGQKAVMRYKIKHGELPADPEEEPKFLVSRAKLPDEKANIEMMKERFKSRPALVASLPSVPIPGPSSSMKDPRPKASSSSPSSSSSSSSSSPLSPAQLRVPKDMLPLAGLDPTNWLRPVSAQDLTLQRLHLFKFDPHNRATHGNYPYDWMDNEMESAHLDPSASSSSPSSFVFANDTYAKLLVSKPLLTTFDLKKAPLTETEDFLSESDPGVKLARRAGDADLVRDAKYLFSVRNADLNNHADERTIRRYEFFALEMEKLRDPEGPPPTIPRRVQLPSNFHAHHNQSIAIHINNKEAARLWLRKKYSSWLGQDPQSSTFDLASVLDPRNDVSLAKSGAPRTTDRPLHIPDPDSVWGPTRKSFIQLTEEMRFQLALKLPSQVEEVLAEEKDKFISELEARLMAYKALEKAASERSRDQAKFDRLGQLDARIKALEQERRTQPFGGGVAKSLKEEVEQVEKKMHPSGATPSTAEVIQEPAPLSALDDEEYLESITREREALLREREHLKREAVETVTLKQFEPTSAKDDTWLRLQHALEQLKTMVPEVEEAAQEVHEAAADQAEAASLVLVEEPAPMEKTPEQKKYEEILEERKKSREAREEVKKGTTTPEKTYYKKHHGRRRRRPEVRGEGDMVREHLPKRLDHVPRGKKKLAPFRNWFVKKVNRLPTLSHESVTDVEWKKSYGDVFTKAAWQTMINRSVGEFTAQVLNGTPQCVRLNCHSETITDLERFYQNIYHKVDVIGLGRPCVITSTWDVRPEDGAWISSTVWFVSARYRAYYTPEVSNSTYMRSRQSLPTRLEEFMGGVWLIVETAPERNFLVTSFSFDMEMPQFPRQVPEMQEYTGSEDVGRINAPYDAEIEPPTYPLQRPPQTRPEDPHMDKTS
jgi:hypothetical protein